MAKNHKYIAIACAVFLIGIVVFVSHNSNEQNNSQLDEENTEVSRDVNAINDATTKDAGIAVTVKETDPTPMMQKDTYAPIDLSFEIINTLNKEVNYHLDLLEKRKMYEKSFNSGWRPAWYKESPNLTAEECKKMPTAELTRECFISSVYCRELLIASPKYALLKMEAFYPCYKELFGRDDLWKGVAEAYSFLGSRLASNSLEERARIDALMTLQTLHHVFLYPKLHDQIKGNELVFIISQLKALKGVRSYIDPEQGTPGTLFRPKMPVSLINLSVYFMKQYSPNAPEISALSRLQLSKKPTGTEMRAFLDSSISEIERFLQRATPEGYSRGLL